MADNTMMYPTEEEARTRIEKEREFQADKWGMQMHDNGTWSMILGEEVGEMSEACLREIQGNGLTPGMLEHQIDEAVQIAAVATAWAARLIMKRNHFNQELE